MADWSGCITKRGQHVFPILKDWSQFTTGDRPWRFSCGNGCESVERVVWRDANGTINDEIRTKENADG